MKNLLLILFLLPLVVFSQEEPQQKINNFISFLESKELSSQQKIDSLNNCNRYFYEFGLSDKEYDQIKKLIDKEINKSTDLNNEVVWLKAFGEIAFYDKNLTDGITYYEKSLAIYTELKDTTQILEAYYSLDRFYNSFNLIQESIKYAKQRIQLALVYGDTVVISSAGKNLGWNLTNYALSKKDSLLQDSAVKYLELAYSYKHADISYHEHLDKTIIYCMALARSNRREKAIEIAKIEIENPNIKYTGNYPRFLKQIANYYTALNNRDSAFFYYNWMIDEENKKLAKGDPLNVLLPNKKKANPYSVIHLIIAHTHFKQNTEAIKILDYILYGSYPKEPKDLITYFKQIGAKAYFEDKQYKKSAECYQAVLAYNDTLREQEAQKYYDANKAHSEVQIMMEKNRSALEKEKQEIIVKEQNERQSLITFFYSIGLVCLIIFILIGYNRFRVIRKQKTLIEQQKSVVDQKNKEITDSIQYAKRIQNAILPPIKIVKEYLPQSFIFYKPKDIVAGDFYWMETIGDKILFAAADCTGHGVPGAMVSVVCNNGLNRAVREYGLTDPGEILNKTRTIVVEEFQKSEDEVKDGMDIALCSLTSNVQGLKIENEILNPKSETTVILQYSGANNPLWIVRNGELLETKANKQPIGQFDNPEQYLTHTIELQSDDSIYIFSDGYADQFGGENGKKLKTTNFKKLLLSIQNESMERQKQLIDDAFENWRGSLEQLDDVCIIGVRI